METLANFWVKWGRTARRRVIVVGKVKEARCYGGTFESWVQRWQLSQTFSVKWGRTARNACVSAVGKAEEATCNGGTFASWVERWKLAFFLEAVETHRPKARVSAVGKAD